MLAAVARASELLCFPPYCVRLVHPWNMGAAASLVLAPGRAEEDTLVDSDLIQLGENVISMWDKPRWWKRQSQTRWAVWDMPEVEQPRRLLRMFRVTGHKFCDAASRCIHSPDVSEIWWLCIRSFTAIAERKEERKRKVGNERDEEKKKNVIEGRSSERKTGIMKGREKVRLKGGKIRKLWMAEWINEWKSEKKRKG